jgi:hypothetical protein
MRKVGEKISLTIMTLVYLLCSLRYFPEQPATSLFNTFTHLLTVAPFLIGALLLFNSFYQRQAGERPTPAKMLRIALTLGITIEFFIGIFNYLKINQVG